MSISVSDYANQIRVYGSKTRHYFDEMKAEGQQSLRFTSRSALDFSYCDKVKVLKIEWLNVVNAILGVVNE